MDRDSAIVFGFAVMIMGLGAQGFDLPSLVNILLIAVGAGMVVWVVVRESRRLLGARGKDVAIRDLSEDERNWLQGVHMDVLAKHECNDFWGIYEDIRLGNPIGRGMCYECDNPRNQFTSRHRHTLNAKAEEREGRLPLQAH